MHIHLDLENGYGNYPYHQSSNYYSNGWNRKPSRSEVSDFINELMNEAKKTAKTFDKNMILSVLSDLDSKNIETGFNTHARYTSDFNSAFHNYLENNQTSNLDKYVLESDWENLSYWLRTFVENVLSYKYHLSIISSIISTVLGYLSGSLFIDATVNFLFGSAIANNPLYVLGISKIIDISKIKTPMVEIKEALNKRGVADKIVKKLSSRFSWAKSINPAKIGNMFLLFTTIFTSAESAQYQDSYGNLDYFVEKARKLIDEKHSIGKLVLLLKMINHKVYDVPWYRFLEPSVWFLLGGTKKLSSLVEEVYKRSNDKYVKAIYEKYLNRTYY
ncbi:hypothetical protein [Mesomycoplasma ovipneumoniae]|uniref:hypothetical protein n=1 Tax=Mesomycoplasma ovipneumoniae TaxID=29562 RepID=UPI00083E85C4|nr:hypothetical protein [Mesomycoplasma ovipneumoniae]WDV48372.1 hypothetical protein PWA39_02460 [Mesomycoplasma ovipneumoniae ATCC 29419]